MASNSRATKPRFRSVRPSGMAVRAWKVAAVIVLLLLARARLPKPALLQRNIILLGEAGTAIGAWERRQTRIKPPEFADSVIIGGDEWVIARQFMVQCTQGRQLLSTSAPRSRAALLPLGPLNRLPRCSRRDFRHL